MLIRPFALSDTAEVIALWQACGLTRPWNDPRRDIARKMTTQPELFLVGTLSQSVIASAMVGFDGHRGWLYYLAVSPEHQRRAYGRQLVAAAEELLLARGCPKMNLLVRKGNAESLEFYRRLGYTVDDVVSLGRRLISDE